MFAQSNHVRLNLTTNRTHWRAKREEKRQDRAADAEEYRPYCDVHAACFAVPAVRSPPYRWAMAEAGGSKANGSLEKVRLSNPVGRLANSRSKRSKKGVHSCRVHERRCPFPRSQEQSSLRQSVSGHISCAPAACVSETQQPGRPLRNFRLVTETRPSRACHIITFRIPPSLVPRLSSLVSLTSLTPSNHHTTTPASTRWPFCFCADITSLSARVDQADPGTPACRARECCCGLGRCRKEMGKRKKRHGRETIRRASRRSAGSQLGRRADHGWKRFSFFGSTKKVARFSFAAFAAVVRPRSALLCGCQGPSASSQGPGGTEE